MSATKRMAVEDLVDMTAMVDIVFFVLIFFMITSMEGVYASINMPSPDTQRTTSKSRRSAAQMDSEKESVIIRIDRDNTIWLNDVEVPSEQELLIRLRDIRQGGAGPNRMTVLGNSEAKHGTLVTVLDAGYEAGIEDIQLAFDDES
jgi:biopolymer transport protein ExbD